MKLAKFALAPAVLLAASLFATNAFADIDIRASVNASSIDITEDSVKIQNGAVLRQHLEFADPMVGATGTISVGYRWTSFGLYLEQDFGGVWWTGATSDLYKYDEASLIGGTFLTAKFILQTGATHIDLGFGMGAMYSSGSKHNEPQNSYAIIVDRNCDPSAAFAIRFTLGFTYYFEDFIGIGLHLDYNAGFNYIRPNKAIWGNVSRVQNTIHQFNPGLHIAIKLEDPFF